IFPLSFFYSSGEFGMNRNLLGSAVFVSIFTSVIAVAFLQSGKAQQGTKEESLPSPEQDALQMIKEGRRIFRYDTFGDEDFWGGALKLHQAIAGGKLGGVGPGVSPNGALAVGLKVDMEALPAELVKKIKQKQVDLDDPASTLALLKLDAVVGVKGDVDDSGKLRSVGITCAICHSTVDDAFAPGIGRRLDGWPNRD